MSVTLVSNAYAVQGIKINFTPYDKAMFLVTCGQISESFWPYCVD